MRVIQLLPELNEGGVERGVVELSRELCKRGVDSWVMSAGGRLASQIEADGGRHVTLDIASKNPLTVPRRVVTLRNILKDIMPDIIHARSRVPAWLAVLANRNLKIPFVTTVHGFNSVNRYSRVMTMGDRVICVSGAIRDYVVEHYAVPLEKLTVIPRGVDLELFDPIRVDEGFKNVFKQKFDLEGKFVVTTVGRVTQLKDYETFISALIILKKSVPNLVGIIVGGVREDKKAYFEMLKRLVKDYEAEEYIHFAGSQSNVAEIYTLSNVVVSSSKKPESFGRSAAEALAMNVPVVATGHGGILDIVIPGKTGHLFQAGDETGLTEGILACKDTEFTGMRDFVMKNFSLERMLSLTHEVYGNVLTGRG